MHFLPVKVIQLLYQWLFNFSITHLTQISEVKTEAQRELQYPTAKSVTSHILSCEAPDFYMELHILLWIQTLL